jgi:octaprenyl-diphosphate synthase
LPRIIEIVRGTGALQATREAAVAEATMARDKLASLPESVARKALLELSARVVFRSS